MLEGCNFNLSEKFENQAMQARSKEIVLVDYIKVYAKGMLKTILSICVYVETSDAKLFIATHFLPQCLIDFLILLVTKGLIYFFLVFSSLSQRSLFVKYVVQLIISKKFCSKCRPTGSI